MPRVTFTIPGYHPQSFDFDLNREVVTIGRRETNDILISCGSVSGNHAEMHRVKGCYHLIDVGSTNGTYLDGIRQQTVVLHTGMTVKLGDTDFEFILSADESEVLKSELYPISTPAIIFDAEQAAAEKVVAERAAAERAAAERAAAERAAAEQAAAEQAAAEKVAAEKVAAEKVAAEKVAAEKVAAEQAAAEQAAAEKVAAEKAQAEKAQAEKAQAEKAQAEKAQAEKTQAEKAQAEKTQAEKTQAEKTQAEKTQAEKTQAEKAQAEKVVIEKVVIEKVVVERAAAEIAEQEKQTLEKTIPKLIKNKDTKELGTEKRKKLRRPVSSELRDEYSESKALKIGSAFILLLLIALSTTFLYAGFTRHQNKPAETPSTANVNKGDAKNEAPMEAKDKSDGDGK